MEKTQNKTIVKTTLMVIIATIIAKLFGFGREIISGYFLGTTNIADAFNLSTSIPNFFLLVVQQVVSITFIPIYLSLFKKYGKVKANEFTTKCILMIGFVCLLVAIILSAFSSFIVPIFASGFDQDTITLCSNLLRFGSTALLFQSIVMVLTAFNQANKKFVLVSILGLALDISTIMILILYNYFNNYIVLGSIPLISIILQSILVIIFAVKSGYKPLLKKPLFDADIKTMLKSIVPVLFSVAIYQINYLVDKNIASNIVVGGISSLQYAQTITNIVNTIIINSLVNITFNEFVINNASKKTTDNKVLLLKRLKLILIIFAPIFLVLFIYPDTIVKIIFERGAFNSESTKLTADCLKYYALGGLFQSVALFFNKYLNARKDFKTPVFISAIALIINICFNFLFAYTFKLGVGGIALATTLSFLASDILLFMYIIHKDGFYSEKDTIELFKTILIIFCSYAVCLALKQFFVFEINIYILSIIQILLFIILYALAVFISDQDSRLFLLSLFKKKSLRKQTKEIKE